MLFTLVFAFCKWSTITQQFLIMCQFYAYWPWGIPVCGGYWFYYLKLCWICLTCKHFFCCEYKFSYSRSSQQCFSVMQWQPLCLASHGCESSSRPELQFRVQQFWYHCHSLLYFCSWLMFPAVQLHHTQSLFQMFLSTKPCPSKNKWCWQRPQQIFRDF